ncbi:MAG TPA: DUF4349 domain-containing protein [Conexibacter sp.]|nr:DUF4349 domain-containing protein [Conexibacter sp.]
MHDDELSTLLAAERPRPREAFVAELDARMAARFPPRARPAGGAPARRARRWSALLHRPFLPAAATALAVGLVALVVALGSGDTRVGGGVSAPSVAGDSAAGGGSGGAVRRQGEMDAASPDSAAEQLAPGARALDRSDPCPTCATLPGGGGLADARKVERSASVELGTEPDRVDDVAQGVLGVVARFDAIVDQSSVQARADGGEARFELRVPAARLQSALAALSRLPDAQVLSRTDDTRDVNQAYVSIRRALANARAERAGVVRALANADSEDEALRLRARLDELERVIANAERAQRGLDRRIDYSRVSVGVHGGAGGGTIPVDDGSFGIGDAAHDALRVLEVAAGVVVIAAAALVPVALLSALSWPLVRGVRRRRREQALDAV